MEFPTEKNQREGFGTETPLKIYKFSREFQTIEYIFKKAVFNHSNDEIASKS